MEHKTGRTGKNDILIQCKVVNTSLHPQQTKTASLGAHISNSKQPFKISIVDKNLQDIA